MFIQPYSDDYLIYDEQNGRYVLTAKAILDKLGTNLNVSAKDDANGVNALLYRVSAMTYRKMHEYGNDGEQDKIIAATSTGRKIIKAAMLEQFFYIKSLGDLNLSVKEEERKRYASDSLEDIFNEIIPEIGCSIINIGRW